MTSKDDDTLPLPGFSQEFSTDASIDEDFIPTTQPESSDNSKLSKNPELKSTKSPESEKSPPTHSRTEGMASPEGRIDQSVKEEDKSVDFIPSTETKSTPNSYATEDISCKKKIAVFKAEDAFKNQGDALWESDPSKLAESPALGNQSFSILNDTPIPISDVKVDVKREEYVTEIIVNDSAETVDLEQSPVNVKKSESQKAEEKLEVLCSLNSDTEKCEETQLFDYSSVLLLGQPGSEKSDRFSSFTPDKSYLQETLDDNLQNVGGVSTEGSSAVVATELSKEGTQEDVPKINGNISPDKQVLHNSTTVQNSSPMVYRKMDFKLSVSCCFTLNTKTNKVLHKRILKVEEIKKPKTAFVAECVSDNMSDKSKRHSTSSSGSVYSDKTGLPFALPKRVSAISAASDQTDSSDDDLAIILQQNERKSTRIPWTNEYLLPLKMDDIMQVTIEKRELPKKKHNVVHDDKVNHLKQILENSSSERTSTTGDLQPDKEESSEETLEKEETESLTPSPPEENKQPKEDAESNNDDPHVESVPSGDTEKAPSEEPEKQLNSGDETGQDEGEDKDSVVFYDGLPVLARWTDKRYYSGVLCGRAKNDRWDVKFDDGASKMVPDYFIIPFEWLKVGALVFALSENDYKSGQIVDIKEGKEEATYVVELDAEKKKISVKKSDLRMTDFLVGIVKEKYKPASCTPRVKADIDFDNVLSGKRLREQKTPSQPQAAHETGSLGGKKKFSSKAKKDDAPGADEISETPMKRTGRALRGLRSENGHLVEDKAFSTKSPSGNETRETPLRGISKKPELKPKPRSLSYEYEEMRSRRKLNKSYLRSDGTPIPGTSGVKFKKQKVTSRANNSESPESKVRSSSKKTAASKVSQSTVKSKRKRKLEESLEDSAQKTALKDGSSRPKRKLRN